MPKPDDNVLYLFAVRTKAEPSGELHSRTMQGITEALEAALPVETIAQGAVVTLYSVLTANHNGYLREFGFDFDTANRLVTVVWNSESQGASDV